MALVSCGRDVWSEYEKFTNISGVHDVMCINDMIFQFKVKGQLISHAVSIHKEFHAVVKEFRQLRNPLQKFVTHAVTDSKGVDYSWPELTVDGGTSSLLGVKIALLLGYSKIAICGVPMDSNGHYYDPIEPFNRKPFHRFGHNLASWTRVFQKNPRDKERIRSYSGQTKALFGEPTRDWLSKR